MGAPAAIASSSTMPNDSPPVAGETKTVGGREELGLLGVADAAEELDALEPARRHVAPRLALLGPGADEQEPAS